MKKIMKDKMIALMLAIFAGPFTWMYTYKQDHKIFWWALILYIVFSWTIVVPFIIWLAAVVSTVNRKYNKDKMYKWVE